MFHSTSCENGRRENGRCDNDLRESDRPKSDRPKNDRRENDHRGHSTILLVEDDSFVQEATRSILEHAGFFVLPCDDASVAITTYEQCDHFIDLVMTDMVLPGRDGRQLGEDLRRRSPQLRVLVTSGYGNAEFETEDPAQGTYFLAKPYSRKSLIEKIEFILDHRSHHHVAAQAS